METMALAVVGLAGSGIGTALGMPMVWPAARRSTEARLIGGGLLGVSLVAAIISARVIGLLPGTPGVNHAVNLVGLASYPFLYLYVREQTGQPVRMAGAWWLWLPCAAYIALLVSRSTMGLGTRVPFAWMLPVLLAFTGLCVAALVRRRERRQASLIPVAWIVGFLIVLNAAQVVRLLFADLPGVRALIPLVATGGFMALVALLVSRAVSVRSVSPPAPDEPRYARSGLDEASAAAILGRIDRALSAGRLFADPALTLARLAAAIDSTPHQLSEVLNRYANISFHEMLNQRRVSDVKAQLLDAASDRYTIEGIGASAGFGSRSSLYAAFRRLEGVTPAEFRARQRTLR